MGSLASDSARRRPRTWPVRRAGVCHRLRVTSVNSKRWSATRTRPRRFSRGGRPGSARVRPRRETVPVNSRRSPAEAKRRSAASCPRAFSAKARVSRPSSSRSRCRVAGRRWTSRSSRASSISRRASSQRRISPVTTKRFSTRWPVKETMSSCSWVARRRRRLASTSSPSGAVAPRVPSMAAVPWRLSSVQRADRVLRASRRSSPVSRASRGCEGKRSSSRRKSPSGSSPGEEPVTRPVKRRLSGCAAEGPPTRVKRRSTPSRVRRETCCR